jgi:hypothetical protein
VLIANELEEKKAAGGAAGGPEQGAPAGEAKGGKGGKGDVIDADFEEA